ncbi:MAG: 5'-nucleotidase C-terminal domain-containing protein [Elusimicrobia bacterium]|nr:5'-nucleotidase C-terminal domain-containing protein [Elusimicrobiota bacterium]
MVFATARSQGRLWSEDGRGGFAAFKNLYDSERKPKLAVDLGNWISATPEGRLTGGTAAAECAAAVPYSAAAIGMEELALSPDELERLAEAASIPLLASNLYLRSDRKPDFLRSWSVSEAGGRKVGFFSLLINSPEKPNSRKYLPNYKLEKETYEAERAIHSLREAGAQIIVMLLDINPAAPAGQEYFRTFLSKLPRVDLVITDDPSIKKPFKVKRAWIAGAGHGMKDAARITLYLDPDTGRVTDVKLKKVELDVAKLGESPAVLTVVERHRKAAATHFSKKIGFLSAPLPLQAGGDYPAADFTADCMRRWARTNAAIIGIDEVAAPLSSGPVTLGHLYSSFPRESSLVFVKIRGEDLERALDGLHPYGITVSGLKLYLRGQALEKTEGENGPLVPGRVYHLAVPDSLASGRDNPVLSSAMEFANSKHRVRDAVRWCLARQGVTGPPAGGRLVRATAD